MKRDDVDIFEKLTAQLGSLHQEMSALAKKSPNDAINNFKIQLVNGTPRKMQRILRPAVSSFLRIRNFLVRRYAFKQRCYNYPVPVH